MLRGVCDKRNRYSVIHRVSAFATRNDGVMGQLKADHSPPSADETTGT
nr:hypothetical protein SYMBAF_90096 [Serratia symbiotica]